MKSPRNEFKRRLHAGEALHGLWLSLASPIATEAVSLVGFDWLLFDTEHSAVDIGQVQPLLQAAAAGTASSVVRPAWNDPVLIKRILDIGAQTILVPFVQTKEEAGSAIAATRYPPAGTRGVAGVTRASRFGLASDYFDVANREICVLAQIETTAALDQLEAIAAVDGVDGLFVGPSNLAASLGYPGRAGHQAVQEVVQSMAQRIHATGKAPGILATKSEDAIRYRRWGYRFVAAALDIGILLHGARDVLARLRDQEMQP